MDLYGFIRKRKNCRYPYTKKLSRFNGPFGDWEKKQHAASGGHTALDYAESQKLIITNIFRLYKTLDFEKLDET
jgi:hypothetical protein